MENKNSNTHFLLLTFPSQGSINPSLQFAKKLIRTGAHVTFVTSTSAHKRMLKSHPSNGLTYAPFSDGYDDGVKPTDDDDVVRFMSELKRRGSQYLTNLITDLLNSNQGRRVTCLIYTPSLNWAADVAQNLNIPSALLWIQPATVFDFYYYYFSGYGDIITKYSNDSSSSIELPGLPALFASDFPSFFLPSNPYKFALPSFEEQFQFLERETKPLVLVNSFDALESDALKAINKYRLIGIGPLIPFDLSRSSTDYIDWLNSKPKASVVYVSFGSIAELPILQMEEIGRGLVDSGRPFLWVIRESEKEKEVERENRERILKIIGERKEEGMIVPWCSQVEVLSHVSLGCFVTHCGWNSTLESLATGVPVVAFPQWTDQATNAKLIEDIWRIGVRVRKNEERVGTVESGEIKRCLEIVMDGERGEEMRRNAKKWRDLAKEAVEERGSSDKNLREFVDVVIGNT